MAITNTVYPSAMHPAFNDVIYRCTSTNSAETNFQMSVDVEVDSIVVASLFKRYGTYSEFNISEILQACILDNDEGHDVITGGFGVQSPSSQNSALNYTLTFREWYDNSSGILIAGSTLSVTTISGSDIYAYNFALQDSVFDTQAFSDYDCTTSTGKFLTNGIHYLATGEFITLSFLRSTAGTVRGEWSSYTQNGVLVDSDTSSLVTINNNRGMLLVNSNPFTSTVSYVDVHLEDSIGTQVSEKLRIYKNNVACEFRLEFKNLLGGIDAYSFREYESSIRTSRELENINEVYKTLKINPNSEMLLKGKNETNDVITWLSEMHTSRVAYLTDNTNRERVQIVSSGDVTASRNTQIPNVRIRLNDKKLN